MVYVMVSVRDAKTEAFGRPFFVQSDGQAIRSFDDEVNRSAEDNIMHHHPEDFQLFKIGTFDDSTGRVDTTIPKMLIAASDVKQIKLKNISVVK